MITPRATRLLRAPDLRAMQRAILSSVPAGWEARETAVIVPTTSAAEEVRRTMEDRLVSIDDTACIVPDLVTRSAFYGRLHQRSPGAPPLLTEFEREVLLRLAIEDARRSGADAPFRLRPGLLAAILAFYDELRRRGRTIDSFDRHVRERLEAGSDTDRGAARLLAQTVFLAGALAAFERRVADSGRIDEHALRALVLSTGGPPAYRHIIVTVADEASDPHGLWPADFDLLSRLPGLERLDLIATERVLAAGWHQRLHEALPGIEEQRLDDPVSHPVLLVPERRPAGEPAAYFVARDREEEVVEAARWIKGRARTAGARSGDMLDRTAVVFQRPLPYLYLARQVFGAARLSYQAFDALPLAAEPFAAAVDLVFAVAAEDATRTALLDLLTSPHWRIRNPADPDRPLGRRQIAALDRILLESKFLGGWDALARLAGEAAAWSGGSGRIAQRWRQAAPALSAAVAVGGSLHSWRTASSASEQITAILDFVAEHERPPLDDADRERHLRARGAVLGALGGLREAHRLHDDRPLPLEELLATLRRWIERQTFAPRSGASGVRLLDARAAACADVDAVRLVGLLEADWPGPASPGVFYPAALLRDLGWQPDSPRLLAERARFEDLLRLPREQVSVSVFTLEDDGLVRPSPFLEDMHAAGLSAQQEWSPPSTRIFAHEALMLEPVIAEALSGNAADWLQLREARTSPHDPRYHGAAGPRPHEVYAVSRVERFLECPFKYFAGHVLQLDEERDDESGLTPQERGQFLHRVFEAFFRAWAEAGHGAVTTENLGEAVALFAEVAEAGLASLPDADRALERTYLLGSAAAAGLAERAFAFEIEHGVEVVERLLEHPFEGTFVFDGGEGPRRVQVRGKADRIDLLADHSLRVIDYKLGKAPKPGRALQLPVYGVCASQSLAERSGGVWPLRYAGYVAFREKHAFTELGGRSGALDEALREGQHRFLAAVDRIEAGHFPVDPEEPWLCTRCGFSHVCRKDYVGDD